MVKTVTNTANELGSEHWTAYTQDAPATEPIATQVSELPEPKGYRLLVRMYRREKSSKDSLIYVPPTHGQLHDMAGVCAQIIAMGADAYKSETKFPYGPYCSVGDWVMFGSYAGLAFKMHGSEELYRLINDDTVQAVIADPDVIGRA